MTKEEIKARLKELAEEIKTKTEELQALLRLLSPDKLLSSEEAFYRWHTR